MFGNKFSSIPSMLHLFLAKIFGKVLNFIIPSYLEINKVWLAKILFDIIPLANITEEKAWCGFFGAKRVKVKFTDL